MQLTTKILILGVTLVGVANKVFSGSLPYPNPVACPGPKVEVKTLNGSPALFLDGKPHTGIMTNPSWFKWGTGNLPVVRQGKLYLANEPGNYAYRSIMTTATFGTHYIAEATLTPVQETGQGPGISLAVQVRGSSSYLLSLSRTAGGGGMVNLWKEEANRKDGPYKWITVPFDWKMGTPYHLRLTIDGNKIEGFIDGKSVGASMDKDLLLAGKVQIGVYHCLAEVDGIKVSALDGATVFQDDFSIPRPQEWSGQPLTSAKDFTQAGIHLYTAVGWGGSDAWSECWKGPGQYDFTKIDKDFTTWVKRDPHALFVPRLYLDPPAWWMKLHPQEASVAYAPGGWSTPDKRASFTSDLWRKETGEFLRQYIRHLNSAPYGKHIVGFTYGGGGALEWVYNWSAYFHDYGPQQTKAFRRWLREKYGTVVALRNSWKDPNVTFETAAIPTPRQRQTGSHLEFYDPAKGRQVPDYMRFHSIAVSDAVKYFARIMKEETQGKKLVLAFYGYHLNATNPIVHMNMGHQDLADLLDCPDIDAFASPHFYTVRQAGGVTLSPVPFDSVLLHGKLFFDEDDIRTHLAPSNLGEGRTETAAHTIGVMKRDFASLLSKGVSLWWMDWGNGWYNDDSLMETVKRIRQIAEYALTQDRCPNAQIAVVVSETATDYLRTSPSPLGPLLTSQMADGVARIGAPFDVLLLSDVAKARDYRFYIFLDTFYMTDTDRKTIAQKLGSNRATALWMVAPGYVTPSGLSIEAAAEITGIKLAANDLSAICSATLEKIDDPLIHGVKPGTVWKAGKDAYGPIFYADDPQARILALLHATAADGRQLTKPGLVVKDLPTGQSIWCGVPNLPTAMLRNMARAAGVHIYCDTDDAVHANRFMVAVHARVAGKRVISLPEKSTVRDAFTGKIVAQGVKQFEMNLDQFETGFWLLSTEQ